MDTPYGVSLLADGTFTVEGPQGSYSLLFDGADERWLLAGPPSGGNAVATLMATAGDLDHGLRLLLAASGRLGPFSVSLPCGKRFLRPGKVQAVEILSALGYAEVRSVTAFTVLARPSGLDADAIRREIVMALSDGPVSLGEVEATETEGEVTYWCCDLSVPFEGVLDLARVDALVEDALSGTGFEPAGRAEAETDRQVSPNAAAVLPLRTLTQAA